ncbi:lactate utilization protein [Marinobacter sp. CHS3-4]|uniref:LutC/YkgG family protein n=1 Tax=Marinobacter sp. CHS3-4 TaxID=3045174 RepID=UPI0024B5ED8E|nr:lactate utilization protein [Marinobacter sp. CHS3-4]MDI9244573.1 lactate utilization protein [Marinobacter sp. CHS3-4]
MSSRDTILQRLRNRSGGELRAPACDFSVLKRPDWSTAEKLGLFQKTIESVHAEVHRTTEMDWIEKLIELMAARGVQSLLASNGTEVGHRVTQAAAARDDFPEVRVYDKAIEQWQEELFSTVDVGITSTRGGIAETGTLILWPSSDEPRLMSLVPPIHVAVLYASELYSTFHEAMQKQNWRNGMPTNALLVSGPSKTADIEQTLAYGVHGPKELIVLVIE